MSPSSLMAKTPWSMPSKPVSLYNLPTTMALASRCSSKEGPTGWDSWLGSTILNSRPMLELKFAG